MHRLFPRPAFAVDPRLRASLPFLGWALVIWLIVFWRLGYPSFWDPGDEAHYAQASREMLHSGNWLVPTYNGQLFPDKPILFYLLQILAYLVFGETEFAARLVPAFSAVGLFVVVAWFGRQLFSASSGSLGALMLAVLPATFALSSYAILDMTFTLFLFAGVAQIVVSALRNRPRLQWGGYVCIALAVLTKGPLGIVLAVLGLGLAMAFAPAIARPLFRLRWVRGSALVALIAAPWFVYMWWQFGHAFIEGYALRENFWLYTRGLADAPTKLSAGRQLSYTRVLLAGLLPWTPILIGRLVDLARGRRLSVEERVLWAWVVGVTGFFAFSSFKLDHYLYPVAPAACLLAAQAWREVRAAPSLRPHAATIAGIVATGVIVAGSGLALVPLVRNVPVSIGLALNLLPPLLFVAGAIQLVRVARRAGRPPATPVGILAGMVGMYAIVLVAVVPEFERAKPIKTLAQWVETQVPADAVVGAYRLNRWNTSWRFYVERVVHELYEPEAISTFLDTDHKLIVMLDHDYEELVNAGHKLRIVQQKSGLNVTSGRALQRHGAANRKNFLVVARGRTPVGED
jgi:4-amino-4-deoxy-L-arabinose transferase-like glycosyltransferase